MQSRRLRTAIAALSAILIAIAVFGLDAARPADVAAVPPPFTITVDCDLVTAGIQNSCDVPSGTPSIDVGWVVNNDSGSDVLFNDWVLELFGSDRSALTPAKMTRVVGTGDISCPGPSSVDDGLFASIGGSDSVQYCHGSNSVDVASLPDQSATTFAVERFNLSGAQGSVHLIFHSARAFDENGVDVFSCEFPQPPPAYPSPPPCGDDTTINVVPPCAVGDIDCDGVPDTIDNCIAVPNPGQANSDSQPIDLHVYGRMFDDITNASGDSVGDACDFDSDNDGLPDFIELAGSACTATTDPLNADSDADRVLDGAECALGTNPNDAASRPPDVLPPGVVDTDHDGLSDAVEYKLHTDSSRADSDGDGLNDGVEYRYYGTDPLATDSRGDGCRDGKEAASLNADRKVNSTDMLIVAQSFGPAGGPRYVLDFDVNRDGVINSTDQFIQGRVFGPCP